MTDPTGSVNYAYERRGLLKSEVRTVQNVPYVLGYGYDVNGNRNSIMYPDTNTASYGFDFADRPATVSFGGTSIITATSYEPFGPVISQTFANGTTRTMSYDLRYRPLENKLMKGSQVLADYLYAEDAVATSHRSTTTSTPRTTAISPTTTSTV